MLSYNRIRGISCLLASTALVSVASGDAQAKSEKMKIEVGGYFTTLMGWASQRSTFESTSNSTARVKYDAFDIKPDSEIHFVGSTQLDNGLAIEVVVELETDQQSNGSHIDDSFMAFTGNFGRVALGNQDHATVMIANSAPNVGAIPADNSDADNWVIKPTGSALGDPFTHIGGGTDVKITYLSPTFAGFTVGASYVPSDNNVITTAPTTNSQPRVGGNSGTDSQIYDVGLAYGGKLGAASIGADVSYWETHGLATSSFKGWRVAAVVEAAGFALGGGYKVVSDIDSSQSGTATSNDETAYEAGISYGQDAWSVGLTYVSASKELATTTAGEDTVNRTTLGGSYSIGPGIDLLGTLARVNWDDETTADADNNAGWAVIGGVSIAF